MFSKDFQKNTHMSIFMKICPVRAKLYHAGRRTDRRDEANGHFSQFC